MVYVCVAGSDDEEGEGEGEGDSVMNTSGEGEGERTRWSTSTRCGVCKCYGSGDDVSWRTTRTAKYRRRCHSPIDSSWGLVFVLLIASSTISMAQLRPNKDIVVSSSNEGGKH